VNGLEPQLQKLYAGLKSTHNGGLSGGTSTQARERLTAYGERGRITVLWVGHNNFRDPGTVLADIARMTAALRHDRFLVIGLLIEDLPSQHVGGSERGLVTGVNAALLATYGSRFIDAHAIVSRGGERGSLRDAADVALGLTPSSLRVDGLHLNQAGSALVAAEVRQRISEHGW
jgi:lysophospholipase L1-like esterase